MGRLLEAREEVDRQHKEQRAQKIRKAVEEVIALVNKPPEGLTATKERIIERIAESVDLTKEELLNRAGIQQEIKERLKIYVN